MLVSRTYGADQTWAATQGMIWSTIEISVGFICACLPAVKGLLARLFPSIFSAQPNSQKTSIFSGPGSNGYSVSSKATKGKGGKKELEYREEGSEESDTVIMKSIYFKVHTEGDVESTNDLLAGGGRDQAH